jgi:hypothetical protein
MEFSYKISEAEYRQAWKLRKRTIFSRVQRGISLFVASWVVLFLCLIMLWLVVQATAPPTAVTQHPQQHPVSFVHILGALVLNIGPFLAIMGMWVFIVLGLPPLRLRRSYQRDPTMHGRFTVNITPQSISTQNTAGISSQTGWHIYEYWREGTDVIVLVFRSGTYFILGLSDLADLQRSELRGILTAALPKK